MKILTTNSSGGDTFGGIHTRLREHMKYSPENKFYILELNDEKKYIPRDNKTLIKLDVPNLLNGKRLLDTLDSSRSFQEFNEGVESLVNEYQNTIQAVAPDLIVIPGSSLTSYILFKATRREGQLGKAIHSYAGIMEKEIGGYHGEPRAILGRVGNSFTRQEALDNVTYTFPSELVKKTLEEGHGVKFHKYYILPNGISEEFSDDTIVRAPPNDLSLGFVGRLHHVKNANFFLNLSYSLREKANLKIITDLRNIANKSDGPSLLDKLTKGEAYYYHPRSTSELSKFYRTEISALVVPSLFETFCNVAIESVACGTPALLSDRAGATEIYRKYGLDDLIFSITDIDSFHAAIDSARSHDFRISEDVTKKMRKDLSWEKIIKRFNKIAESVVA